MTIVLPNSIQWVQSVLAAWKLGATPTPLSARLPDAELEALLDLHSQALIVGRDDPRGKTPSVPTGFTPDPALSDAELPEVVSPVWKSMASGGSTGRPKLIEAGGDSRFPPKAGYPLGAQEGDVNLVSVPLSHNTGFTTFAVGLVQGHHLVLMPRFEPHEFLSLVTEHRVTFLATVPTIMQRLLPVYRADPGRLRPVLDPPVLAPRRAVPTRDQTGVDRPCRARNRLGAVRRHRTSGADVHPGRSVADPPRFGRHRRRRRDEGPRRRRQRMPARRER